MTTIQTPGFRWNQPAAAMVIVFSMALFVGCGDDPGDFVIPPGDQEIPVCEDCPPAGNLQVANDDTLWGTVHISWDEPDSNSYGYQVKEYLVVASTSGSDISTSNWDQMSILGVIDATGDPSYRVTFDTTNPGILGGTLESFAVRPMYDNDIWGPVGSTVSLTTTRPHYRWGYVKDELGNPLADVTVRMVSPAAMNDPRGFISEQTTNAYGKFDQIGPVIESMPMVLETVSPDTVSAPGAEDAYFDFRTEPLVFKQFPDNRYNFVLITKYELDPSLWWGNFVEYLQIVTWANNSYFGYDLQKVATDSYPLKVYIPDGVTLANVDMDENFRSTIAYFNTQTRKPMLVETKSRSEAQILVEFPDSIPGRMGEATINLPAGGSFGTVVPEVINVRISREVSREAYLNQISRHELGHALGHYFHSNGINLMSAGAPVETLSADEIRIFQAIMGLPNEILFSSYEGSRPDYPTY